MVKKLRPKSLIHITVLVALIVISVHGQEWADSLKYRVQTLEVSILQAQRSIAQQASEISQLKNLIRIHQQRTTVEQTSDSRNLYDVDSWTNSSVSIRSLHNDFKQLQVGLAAEKQLRVSMSEDLETLKAGTGCTCTQDTPSVSTPMRTPRPQCPQNFVRFKNSCYFVQKTHTVRTYDEASDACQRKSSHLVSVETVEEQQFLLDIVNSIPGSSEWLTSGKCDDNSEWFWDVTGEKLRGDLKWGPDEPDNDVCCLSFWKNFQGFFADVVCAGAPRAYICELTL